MNTNPLLALFSDTSALVDPGRVTLFETLLLQAYAVLASTPQGKMALAEISDPLASAADDDYWPAPDAWDAAYRPYTVKDGVLQVPVRGVLLNKLSYQVGGYATGYPYIRKAFDRGMGDANVNGIALMIDSPGGEVAGNFDLVDHMFANKDAKPIRSFASDYAYSAAYNIASVAKINVTRSGGVGSIGVVTSHIDWSKYLEKMGLAVTFISAPEGGFKTEGNPYEPLSKDAKQRIQDRVNELYSEFVSTVARNRGMDEKAIRDTKALTFSASQALENGLADSVGTTEDATAAFAAETKGAPLMADVKEADHNAALAAAETKRKADVDAANAAAGTAAANAVKAERARIAGIMALPEAKDRQKLATYISQNTDMSVEVAKTMLAAAAVETAAAPPPKKEKTFAEAMEKNNPELHQGGGDEEDEGEGSTGTGANAVDKILSAYHAHGGYVKGMDDKDQQRGRRN